MQKLDDLIKSLYAFLEEPFKIGNRSIYVSVSTGISVMPNDADTIEKLIQNADTAMFSAKHNGKATYMYYNELMSEIIHRKLDIEATLRRAIKDNLISMDYQPIINTLTNELSSFEALMRISDENGISYSPDDFIPIAEETGLILDLGKWAVEEVSKSVYNWLQMDYSFNHISVNVSVLQLNHPEFVDMVKDIILKANIEAKYIEFEITESIILNQISDFNSPLSRLKALGFKIALDDFGTGYSSFGYLRSMPLNTLKIDKIFIDNLASSKKDQELVGKMIDISHNLGLHVVSEGVETKEQYMFLRKINCDYIQGYYFSRPLNLENTKEFLVNHQAQKEHS
jgi:EAL domain-containing protein (putative c-di-GMP-specific phosphodiesterase class I)